MTDKKPLAFIGQIRHEYINGKMVQTPIVLSEEEKVIFAKAVDPNGEYNLIVCDTDAIPKMMSQAAAILSTTQKLNGND